MKCNTQNLKRLKFFWLILFNMVLLGASQEGFIGNTLITTPMGNVPIESLVVDDFVYSYDINNDKYDQSLVTHTTTFTAHQYVRIFTSNNTCICTGLGQKFYDPQANSWADAQDLTLNHVLLTYDSRVEHIWCIEVVDEDITLCAITVNKDNTLCVSEHGIVVHNFVPIVAAITWGLGTSVSFGTGVGVATGIGSILSEVVGFGVIAGFFGHLIKSKIKQKNRQDYIAEEQRTSVSIGQNPNQNQQDPNKNKKNDRENKKQEQRKDTNNGKGRGQKKRIGPNFFEDLKKRSDKQVRSRQFGKMYHDPETDLWYSKDKGHCEKVQLKVHKRCSKGYTCVFNADAHGDKIPQHKGPVGMFIPMKDIIGCP
jgi:hypothetical protein